jgi:hypothetical protein
MLIDKSLIDKNHFQLQPEKTKILQLVKETIQILEGQASLADIKIKLITESNE